MRLFKLPEQICQVCVDRALQICLEIWERVALLSTLHGIGSPLEPICDSNSRHNRQLVHPIIFYTIEIENVLAVISICGTYI